MKKILLLLCFFSVSFSINAQTENTSKIALNVFNKYLIKLDSNVTYSVPTTSAFIKMVCAANTADYNNSTKYFEVLTKRTLEQNIINGKLQKNMTPMTEFIFLGQVQLSPAVQSTTISTQ